jgi:hypothetical protein
MAVKKLIDPMNAGGKKVQKMARAKARTFACREQRNDGKRNLRNELRQCRASLGKRDKAGEPRKERRGWLARERGRIAWVGGSVAIATPTDWGMSNLNRKLDRTQADAIRAHVAAHPVEAYAAVRGIPSNDFIRSGVEHFFRCASPSRHTHGDQNPSARLNPQKGTYYCDICGEGGDIFTLYGAVHAIDQRRGFRQIVKGLSALFEIVSANGNQGRTMSDEITVADLAVAKKFPLEWLKEIGVVDSPDGRGVRIGYFHQDGKQARRLRLRTAIRAKDGSSWTGPREIGLIPYGLWRLKDAAKRRMIVIVEGESDCWALWFHEFPALGLPGATVVNVLKAEHLSEIDTLFIVQEPGAAGAEFPKRVADRARKLGFTGNIRVIPMTDTKDPCDFHVAGTFERFAELLAAARNYKSANDTDLPEIVVTGKRLRDLSEEALSAIERANRTAPAFFQRSGVLVRLHRDHRELSIEAISPDALRGDLDRYANWYTRDRNGELRNADPPVKVIKDVLSRCEYQVPRLRSVEYSPFFTSDGELVLRSGYHAAAEVFLHLDPGIKIPPVSERPTEEELQYAVVLLRLHLLGDFPFVADCDRAHAFGALLAPFVRHLVDAPMPLHAFDASTWGTGKGLLVSSIAAIVLGHPGEVLDGNVKRDELRKQITALLLSGTEIVLFDNVLSRIDAGALAALLTADVWRDRILGLSKMVSLPNRALWMVTGNNLSMSGEIVRRTVRIRLDAEMEDPASRTGFRHNPLTTWVRANRGDLLWAVLTIIQNWIASGRLPFTTRSLGSFEPWARAIGGILEAAGISGFLEGRKDLSRDTDRETASLRNFVGVWWETHGTSPRTVSELFPIAQDHLDGILGGCDERSQKIKLGLALAAYRDRIFAGRKIVPADTRDEKSRSRAGWALVETVSNPRAPSSAREIGGGIRQSEDSTTESSTFAIPNVAPNPPWQRGDIGSPNTLNLKGNPEFSQSPNVEAVIAPRRSPEIIDEEGEL